MLGVLPPLFMRAGMFALSELKAGFVGSVFFDIDIIDGRRRWFTGYCNLGDRSSPPAMRTALIPHEAHALATLSHAPAPHLHWALTPATFPPPPPHPTPPPPPPPPPP